MDSRPLIAVAVITSGEGVHFARSAAEWIEKSGFVLGKTLFFCGPRSKLAAQRIASDGIVDYVDPPYYRNNFHINAKKLTACEAIDAEYIYLLHDRFIPQPNFMPALRRLLHDKSIDFGAVDVDNLDGTPALCELRVKDCLTKQSLDEALGLLGRIACSAKSAEASHHIAVNGGQFFLRKSLANCLRRPMRWMEMEDDVLSHDLLAYTGKWFSEARLYTVNSRMAPTFRFSPATRFKFFVYRVICNLIALFVRLSGRTISAGQSIPTNQLRPMLSGTTLLIDPLYKMYSSEFLPSSLEKIMTRARILSNGECWIHVDKHRLGWRLVGPSIPQKCKQ